MSDRLPKEPLGRLRLPLVLALAAAYSLLLAREFRFNNVDDAYIAFRYGWNLMQGHGLVFNPGERVEGYTSFLWTLGLAPATRAGFDIVWCSIGLGVLASLAALWGLDAHLRLQVQRGASPWIFAALPLVAFDNSWGFWAVGGMEAPLFAALLLWATWVGMARAGQRAAFGCGVLLGFATLTRPEGALALLVVALLRLAARTPQSRREVALLAAGWACLVLPHLVWRRAYYGAWLPNTFHNKVTLGGEALRAGAAYVASFVRWRYGVPALMLLALLRRDTRQRFALPFLLVIAYLGYVVVIGGDWPVANRFVVPVLPFVHLLVVAGLASVIRGRTGRGAVLAAMLLANAAGSYLHADSEGLVRRLDNVAVETQRKRFGIWLRESMPAGTWIATGPSGAIPYYSRLPTLDMWGLTDAHIARVARSRFRPGHDRTDLPYVLSRRPELVIGTVGFTASRIPAGYRRVDAEIPPECRPREIVLARRGPAPE